MKKIKNFLFFTLAGTLMINAHAQNNEPNAYAFMTSRDVKTGNSSNVTITNGTNQSIPIAGLYIASFDINDCSACTGNIMGGDNLGGAVASPATIQGGQRMSIGQNYLYNMIYSGIYYINLSASSPCSLPGCSWPSDNPSVNGWCITINAASANSSYTYSYYRNGSYPAASIPAYGAAGYSPNPPGGFYYKYALIDPATLGAGAACIGPVVCNDQTMTCQVSTAQNETFESY